MKINKERTGCGLSIDSPYSPEELKKKMNLVAEHMTGIFVPSDVSWDRNNYYFYISHRQSLKEYIYEKGFKPKDFYVFVRALADLFKRAREYGIDGHEFILDYECVFVGSSLSEMEFIYAPDKGAYKDGKLVNNKCSDMVALVSLHVEYVDYETSEETASELAQVAIILCEWEKNALAGNNDFPYEELFPFISEKASAFEALLIKYKRKLEEIKKLFLGFLNKKEGAEMKLSGKQLLNGIEYYDKDDSLAVINIGRDKDWADIELGMIFVSRKHATLYKNDNNWFIKDLNSKNGTFVDGVKIASQMPFSLKNGAEISFGLPESKFIFCLL